MADIDRFSENSCLVGKRRGLVFIISSPSGAGKTTMTKALLEKVDNLKLSISATTREQRPNEVHGKDYFFLSKNAFFETKDKNGFIESAIVFGNHYGTPRHFVENELDQGADVLFDIDWQGARQLETTLSDDIVKIFLLPPSLKELHKRLIDRGTDDSKIVDERMKKSMNEISHWAEYDYILVNNKVENTLDALMIILNAERLKRKRQMQITEFVGEMLDPAK